jgi:two-component sensor histidine kinase
MNELVTNCFKHAYQGRKDGVLSLSMHRRSGALIINVQDNGQGILVEKAGEETLGFRLLEMLCRQLKGFYEMKNSGGLDVTIQIHLDV